ncbi:MAG TPA: hypothetical protein VEC37_15755, partial [Bacillota bacterium]|nr:hypothetical protein [Bacillota bacterium]
MKQILMLIITLLGILTYAVPGGAVADGVVPPGEKPILIIIVDKLDSADIFESKHPGIRRLLEESAYGLMSIRSNLGYTKANSGYLTIGSGIRSAAPDELSGLVESDQTFSGLTAQDFWGWHNEPRTLGQPTGLLVPEVGWVYNQALENNKEATPGRLGTLFRSHGWQTFLYGNNDNSLKTLRPGGLLLMDRQGRVDGGRVNASVNLKDPDFPYLNRLDTNRVFHDIVTKFGPKTLIAVDFTDFARLDGYREEMLNEQYQNLKQAALNRLGNLINRIISRWSPAELSLLVVSPTLSMEALSSKRLLAPVIIRSTAHRAGVLSSGTTNWSGIISNIDLLPTLLELAGIKVEHALDGRPVQTQASTTRHETLLRLFQRINGALAGQRPILDWYLGLITAGWLLAYIGIWFRYGKISEWLLNVVAVIPLTIILLPLLPVWTWQVPGFLTLTLVLSLIFGVIRDYKERFLVLTALTWLILTVDQFTGWNLIRYSALGYSPAAGARNYGMGNEYMGIFLPMALLLSNLIYQKTHQRWPTGLILAITTFVLGMPKLGVNFGGTLAAIIGFTYYMFLVYQWKLKSRNLVLVVIGGLLLVMAVGYWDALRGPEQQTHVGRFFRLIFSNHFAQVFLILQRKVEMNLKLLVMSP